MVKHLFSVRLYFILHLNFPTPCLSIYLPFSISSLQLRKIRPVLGLRFSLVVLIALHVVQVASPQGQVITEQLHDGGGVAVLVLLEAVQVGNSIVEGLLGKFAGDLGRAQNLIIENAVVQSQAEADWVGRFQLFSGVRGLLVSILRVLNNFFAAII